MLDAPTIWQRLRAEKLVSGDRPSSDSTDAGPWVVRFLTAAAAWIASLLFLGFVVLLLGSLGLTEMSTAVIGGLLCAATLPPLLRPTTEFMQQGATVVSVAGMALIGGGLSSGFDLPDPAVATTLAVVSAALFAVSRVETHRFLCAVTLVGACLWLIADVLGHELTWVQPIAAWLAAALWWFDLSSDPAGPMRRHVALLAWAATLAAIALGWFALNDWWATTNAGVIAASSNITALLLPVTAVAVGAFGREGGDRRLYGLLIIASIALAWLWHASPGITFALVLMLLAFARGVVVLLASAVATLAVYLVQYYYQLTVPLLNKSLWLGLAGIVLLVLHVVLRYWPPRRTQ